MNVGAEPGLREILHDFLSSIWRNCGRGVIVNILIEFKELFLAREPPLCFGRRFDFGIALARFGALGFLMYLVPVRCIRGLLGTLGLAFRNLFEPSRHLGVLRGMGPMRFEVALKSSLSRSVLHGCVSK